MMNTTVEKNENTSKLQDKQTHVTDITETSYEDGTFWVTYTQGDNFGYEITSDKNKVEQFKQTNKLELVIPEKPNLNVCTNELKDLIEECHGSDNEMWFVEPDEISEDELLKLKKEIEMLDLKFEGLQLSEYIIFGEDGCAITVYGGVITRFLF